MAKKRGAYESAGLKSSVTREKREATIRSKAKTANSERKITERGQYEAELTCSERNLATQLSTLESLISSLGGGVVIADADGKFLHFNETAERIVGLGATDHPPHKWSEYYGLFRLDTTTPIPPGETPLERAMKGEEVAESEIFVRNNQRPHGVWCTVVAAPLAEETGRVRGGVVVFRDVTEQKRAEQAVREREHRLRAVLTAAPEAVITICQNGVIDTFNPAAERLFGYSAKEAIGQDISILMPSPYREEHRSYLDRYLATHQPRIIGTTRELTARRKDGSTVPIELSVSEVDHLGLFTGFIRDITERKALQRNILDVAVEEQNRIGQDLHDGMGQELTGLNYMTQTLLEVLDNPEYSEKVSLATVVKQSRTLAEKIGSGLKTCQQRLRGIVKGLMPVSVDAEGLRAALEELSVSISTKKLTCELQCAEPIHLANNSVATHLYRIAQEAINNALKHSQADLITISLSEENSFSTLTIHDNGVGIAAARGETPGMGLHIMEYRASLIGATLDVGPDAGGGTLVRCRLSTM